MADRRFLTRLEIDSKSAVGDNGYEVFFPFSFPFILSFFLCEDVCVGVRVLLDVFSVFLFAWLLVCMCLVLLFGVCVCACMRVFCRF